MIRLSRKYLSIGRERAQRRVLSDEFEQISGSSLKASKLPPGFVNFDNIESLRPRELAYTAHLAHRVGMENESLWMRIHSAFMESIEFKAMRPKFLTQCVVALSNREEIFSENDLRLILRKIGARVAEFRPIDHVLLLHSLSHVKISLSQADLRIISSHLSTCDLTQMSPKSIAILLVSLGKLRVNDPVLVRKCFPFIESAKELFNQYEVAGIVRSFSVLYPIAGLSREEVSQVVASLVQATDVSQLDAGCINILLHAFGALEARDCVGRIIDRLSSCIQSADSSLLPHLLLGLAKVITNLNEKDSPQTCVSGVALSVRIASCVDRQYTQFKAVALPVAVEALRQLSNRLPDNMDFKVLLTSLSETSERVIDQYLVIATESERRSLLDSKYCVSSDWLRDRVMNSLPSESSNSVWGTTSIIDQIHAGNVEELLTSPAISQVIDSMDSETAAKALYLLLPFGKAVMKNEHVNALLTQATTTFAESITSKDLVFSLLLRYMLRSPVPERFVDSTLEGLAKAADGCDARTLARALEVSVRLHSSVELRSAIALSLISKIDKVSTKDLLAVLRLLRKADMQLSDATKPESIFLDFAEAKLAKETDLTKSVSKREALQEAAKQIGIASPSDVMEDYEVELEKEKKSKVFTNFNVS